MTRRCAPPQQRRQTFTRRNPQCYAMLSVVEEARGGGRQSYTKAIVVRERHVQLSRELSDPIEEANALNGLGHLMLKIDRFR
jgi:hypothetical protein